MIDKSLVVCDTTGPRARHHLLTVVADYALARLREAGEEDELRHRHARIQADLLTSLEPLLATDKDAWRERVREFRTDLLSAVGWCLSGGDTELGRRLAAAAGWWWHLTGDRPGFRLLQRAAELDGGDDALQARVLVVARAGRRRGPARRGRPGGRAGARTAALAIGDRATVGLARQLVAIGLIEGRPGRIPGAGPALS